MTIDLREFRFDLDLSSMRANTQLIVEIPEGLNDRTGLFAALRRGLRLPKYFGENWDALSDCLRDLSWIKFHQVVIMHSDVPNLGDVNLCIYLDILSECVKDWRKDDGHELIAAFPPEAYGTMKHLVE